MRRLTTNTIEEQIGELDAFIDDLLRKPRKEITNIVYKIPGGCLIEPVVSGAKVFVGFFTVAGSIESMCVQLPDSAKPCQVVIELATCTKTSSRSFSVSKGCNCLSDPLTIEAGTKISVSINTDSPISSALFGYTLVPEG